MDCAEEAKASLNYTIINSLRDWEVKGSGRGFRRPLSSDADLTARHFPCQKLNAI